MSLVDRIRRGEAAIAAAKAEGRDVTEWEEHLEKLKREAELQHSLSGVTGKPAGGSESDCRDLAPAVWGRS